MLYRERLRNILVFFIALFLIASAILLVFLYYLLPPHWDKNFGLLDERFYFGPNAFYLDTCIRNGEYPFWNPLSYCGMPFSADPQASACYPPHLLRSLLTPAYNPYATMVSMHILRFLHILWAGLGIFFLARLYKTSVLAGIVAAFVFIFNAFSIVHFTEFYVFSLVMAWAPWVLWGARRALHAETLSQWIVYTVFTIIFFAYSVLGGFPQLSLYMGMLLGMFTLFDGLMHFRWRLRWDIVKSLFTIFGKRLIFLVIVVVLTGLAAAVLLLPAFEFGRYSARAAGSGVQVAPWPQNLHWLHLLKCLVIFPGNLWLPQGCRAAGIGSLLVAIAALGHRKWRDVWVFVLMYLVFTDCTLGPPFPVGWLLNRFDFLNITLSPWRAGCFSGLPLALVVAFGIDAAGAAPIRWWLRGARTLVFLVAGVAMLTLLYYWLYDNPLRNNWYLVWHIPALLLVVLCVFSLWRAPKPGAAVVAVLVGAEILAWSTQMTPIYIARAEATRLGTEGFGTITRITTENKRTAQGRPNWHMFRLDPSILGYNPLYVGQTREVLCRLGHENYYRILLKSDDVLVENQRGHLLVKRSFWLARQWVAGEMPGKEELFPAAITVFLTDIPTGTALPVPELGRDQLPSTAVSDNVRRINLGDAKQLRAQTGRWKDQLQINLPHFDQENKHSTLFIGYKGTGPVDFRPLCRDVNGPFQFLKRTRSVNTRGAEHFLEIPLPDCNRNAITLRWSIATAFRVELTRAFVLIDEDDEDDLIVIEDRTANTVTLLLKNLPEARILTFLDSYYPGWRALINGEEVEIHRANDAFKAIVVPPGTSKVRFEFRSATTYAGLTVSLAIFLLLILAIPFSLVLMEKNKENAAS